MTMIPQRELRNDISSVLRRAENGESFTITVNGRPVAELGPLRQNDSPPASLDDRWAADLQAMRDEEHAAGRAGSR
jgi:prevent-host-death family protein